MEDRARRLLLEILEIPIPKTPFSLLNPYDIMSLMPPLKQSDPRQFWLSILSVFASVFGSLLALLTGKDIRINWWIPFAMAAAGALLLTLFTLLLRREPSKSQQLRQTLISEYVNRLAESMQSYRHAGKA